MKLVLLVLLLTFGLVITVATIPSFRTSPPLPKPESQRPWDTGVSPPAKAVPTPAPEAAPSPFPHQKVYPEPPPQNAIIQPVRIESFVVTDELTRIPADILDVRHESRRSDFITNLAPHTCMESYNSDIKRISRTCGEDNVMTRQLVTRGIEYLKLFYGKQTTVMFYFCPIIYQQKSWVESWLNPTKYSTEAPCGYRN